MKQEITCVQIEKRGDIMYNVNQLNLFWQSIRPIQGTTKFAVQFNGQTIVPQDFDFIYKDGVGYIYDKINDKLYDQYLNYYQNGTYFDSSGTPKTEVKNDNIFDANPDSVYRHTPQEGIEYFDSDGNSLGHKKPKPQYTTTRGPRLKEKNIVDIDSINKWINENNLSIIAETNEAKQLLYNHVVNNKPLSMDTLARANASAHSSDKIFHAMENISAAHYNLSHEDFQKLSNRPEIEIITENFETIINNKNAELSLSGAGKDRFGKIGVYGTADVMAYFPIDMRTTLDSKGKRIVSKENDKTLDKLIQQLQQGKKINEYITWDEYIGKNINVESIWVEEDFYNQYKKEINSMAHKNGVYNIDIIDSDENIKRITLENTKKKKYKASRGPRLKKEETTITIEDDNVSIKTETSSTENTNIPDSSKNQNNAEKVKQQEPISNPEKPKPDTSKPEFTPINSEYNKYVWEEYKKGNTDVMSFDEYYKNKRTPEQQAAIDEINNRTPQQPEAKPEVKPESTSKPDTPEVNTKPNTSEKPKPEVKPTNNPEVEVKAETKTPKPDTPKKPKYKPQKGPKTKSTAINATKEQVSKLKKTGMKTKKLAGDAAKAIGEGVNWGKVGKVGAVIGVTALIGGGIYSHAKKEKKNRANGPDRLTGATRKSDFWNQSYAAQMAKDISTYQYGKRMTGFVQG